MTQEGKQFLLLAKRMRDAQKQYFTFKTGQDLKVAKNLEEKFDIELEKFMDKIKGQETLFKS